MIIRFFPFIIFTVCAFALGFVAVAEHIWGIEPCILCIYARIPYWIAMILSLFAIPLKRYLPLLYCITFLTGAGISIYHVGVEHKVFNAPASCSAIKPMKNLNLSDIESTIMNRKVVRCDVVNWRLLTRSASEWNLLLVIILFIFSGAIGREQWIRKR